MAEPKAVLPSTSLPHPLSSFSEESCRVFFDALTEAVYAFDLSGRTITYWNKSATALFGYTDKEAVGRTIQLLHPDPALFMRTIKTVAPAIKEKGCWRGTLEYQGRHGRRFPAEVVGMACSQAQPETVYIVVMHDAGGSNSQEEIAGRGAASGWKITDPRPELREANREKKAAVADREQMEEALEDSEESFRLLVQSVKDYAIFILNPEGRIVTWNKGAERIKGYRAEEIIGRHFSCFYPEEDVRHGTPEKVLKTAAAEGRFEHEGWRRRKDGSRFWAHVVITALRNNDGKLRGFSKVVRDTTERRRLEDKLRGHELLATIGTTAAQLAHELGNPLNGMYTTVQILERHLSQRKDPADGTIISTVQDLMSEINRLHSLLQDFRSLARPERLDLQPVDLAAITSELLAIEERQYTERGIHTEQDFSPDLPLVTADAEKLKQALLNLCNNAVEAMPEGGTLTVRGYPSGEKVFLEVSDTGTGIPEGIDIFEIFSTSKPHGTGFGLAIVKQIASAHEGTVSYTSRPGKGTTFRIVLPLDR